MMLSPAATDTPAASVMMMFAPVLLPVFVPMFLTKAMLARASEAARPNRRASASVGRARRAGLLCESTVLVLAGRATLRAGDRRSPAQGRMPSPRARQAGGGARVRGARRGALAAVR